MYSFLGEHGWSQSLPSPDVIGQYKSSPFKPQFKEQILFFHKSRLSLQSSFHFLASIGGPKVIPSLARGPAIACTRYNFCISRASVAWAIARSRFF